MCSRNLYGGKHIRMEKIMRSGFRSDLRGEVKDAIYSLIKKGFILYAKRSKDAIQLNKEKSNEIQQLIYQNIQS